MARGLRALPVLALTAAVFLALPTSVDAKRKAQPRIDGKRYATIVIEAETGTILHAEDAEATRRPASLTKMMTLYMIFEALDTGRLKLSQRLPVSAVAAHQSPTRLGLDEGDLVTVRDVILALITKSANDAAVVAAEALAGSEDRFGRLMTQQARRIGMNRTTFTNASGLPDSEQVTTAHDMALLARALIKRFPHYYGYFSTADFNYGGFTHANHNRWMTRYEGADGLKTGFTRASGYNLAASAVRHDHRLIGVVMGGTSASARDQQMARIMDASFARVQGLPRVRYASSPTFPSSLSIISSANAATPSPAAASSASLADAFGSSLAEPRPTVRFLPDDPRPMTTSAAAATTFRRPPAPAPATASGWGIQIGAFSVRESAERATEQALKLAPTPLRDGAVSIAPQVSRQKTIYRARYIGLSQRDAAEACKALKRKKLSCLMLSPDEAAAGARVAAN
ncbi:MAG TPA: D-alanyl-D-alanine carboxypeptidase [Alphaproteobacteria bacterium]|nr:D-alanyl-D-alanine carboxypeptidase [Alphaproteobacteria bacterium]